MLSIHYKSFSDETGKTYPEMENLNDETRKASFLQNWL